MRNARSLSRSQLTNTGLDLAAPNGAVVKSVGEGVVVWSGTTPTTGGRPDPRSPALASTAGAFDEVLYYHRDYQGSVIGTSRRGAGVDGLAGAKYRYTPYGQLDRVEGVTAWTDSELGYTGGLRLGWVAGAVTTLATPQAPGLVLLGARVYHAELKRWLVPDTVDPLRYTYTGGDPVNRIDPSGRIWLEYDKHKYGDPPPRLAEDFFIQQTMAYASQGSGSNDSGSSSGTAQGAGDQAPTVVATSTAVTATDQGNSSASGDSARDGILEGLSLLPEELKLDESVISNPLKPIQAPFLSYRGPVGQSDPANHFHGVGACKSNSMMVQALHAGGHEAGDYELSLGRAFFAPADGILGANYNRYGGNQVFLSSEPLGLRFGIAHSSLAPGLSSGDRLLKGQWIGWVDGTGAGTAPHLHATVKDQTSLRSIDPAIYYGRYYQSLSRASPWMHLGGWQGMGRTP